MFFFIAIAKLKPSDTPHRTNCACRNRNYGIEKSAIGRSFALAPFILHKIGKATKKNLTKIRKSLDSFIGTAENSCTLKVESRRTLARGAIDNQNMFSVVRNDDDDDDVEYAIEKERKFEIPQMNWWYVRRVSLLRPWQNVAVLLPKAHYRPSAIGDKEIIALEKACGTFYRSFFVRCNVMQRRWRRHSSL